MTRTTFKLFLPLCHRGQEVHDRTQRSNLLTMKRSYVIINGKTIANLNGRIVSHLTIFKFGIKDLALHCKQGNYL